MKLSDKVKTQYCCAKLLELNYPKQIENHKKKNC